MASTFMRVGAASFRVKAADPSHNAQQVIKRIMQADDQGVQVLLFPELCLTGACCGVLFEHQTMLSASIDAIYSLARLTADLPMLFFVGLPVRLGGQVVSCMAAVQGGRLLALLPKGACEVPGVDRLEGVLTGDILMRVHDVTMQLRYGIEQAPGVGITLHASSLAASYVSVERLHAIFSAGRQGAAVYASGAGDSTTDYVFDGYCAIYENGMLLASGDGYEGTLVTADIDAGVLRAQAAGPAMRIELPQLAAVRRKLNKAPWGFVDCERVLELQGRALAKRAADIGARGFVLGLSGGLDSTLALLACVRAADIGGFARESVLAVMMPGYGSSERTGGNARQLVQALGVAGETISIVPACKQHFKDIGQNAATHDAAFENAQARERTQILMDIANQRGLLNVGTGDLSESALGFTTFGGDHMAFYNINASLLKTQIRDVIGYVARKDKALRGVLTAVLDTPVSPELLPTVDGEIVQRTEDIVGPYELMDFYIYYMLRYAMSCGMLLERARLAFPRYNRRMLKERLEVFIKRFFANQFKRNCMPEGPMLGELSLSSRAFPMPGDASANAWLQEIKALK